MNIFPAFQTILYTISTALLYPVVILLILLSLWLVIYAGGFLAEWVKRRRFHLNSSVSESLEAIQKEGRLPSEVMENLPVYINNYAKELADIVCDNRSFREERVEDLIQRKEYSLLKEVDKIRLIVRIGPSLGLMGTLIPMGTGLAGLTQGNMAQLSSSLILAFTTTVVGLALGITAHFFSVVKERWVTEDMRHIELITEAMTKNSDQ
ncbi:MAG: MotA/TolQ/ExbB proton channel family protein [Deltaproteobacteria bacterium]|nr:MotA/TolQ/ExbB proton channel family protein [Deltaproteobacteria bacterium]MBW2020120.1 MotA/TolQ/ExbB proton channel family protein [Deltaproteobacteria bacterium]MBW2074973.1 MotA/TolQ/ExbB proton channel family protein [Deltaproteobacteria bacterium]